MAEIHSRERAHPRRKIYMTCEVTCGEHLVSGRVIDASHGGIGILFPQGADIINGEVLVRIPPLRESPVQSPEEIILRARPTYRKEMTKGHHVGFRIELIESDELEWKRLCDGLTRSA
jgi:PilZ domain-containing protein